MMVDLSHASDRTFWQVLEIAQNPVCASHSCVRALCPDQMRNLTDEVLTALGARGGYVGVNFSHDFLVGGGLPPEHRATVDDVVRHIEHMAERAGVRAAGIGSDFDGIGAHARGAGGLRLPGRIAEALLRRNWSEADVRGIMGENFLAYWKRVLGRIEQAPQQERCGACFARFPGKRSRGQGAGEEAAEDLRRIDRAQDLHALGKKVGLVGRGVGSASHQAEAQGIIEQNGVVAPGLRAEPHGLRRRRIAVQGVENDGARQAPPLKGGRGGHPVQKPLARFLPGRRRGHGQAVPAAQTKQQRSRRRSCRGRKRSEK